MQGRQSGPDGPEYARLLALKDEQIATLQAHIARLRQALASLKGTISEENKDGQMLPADQRGAVVGEEEAADAERSALDRRCSEAYPYQRV